MRDTVVQSFLENAQQHPDKLCLGFHSVRLTYANVRDRVLACATTLKKKFKVGRGDLVMINGLSKPEYVIVYLATQYLGAVSIPFDKMIKPATLKTLTDYIKPKAVLIDLGEVCVSKVRGKMVDYEPPTYFEQVSEMLFTTGTTGLPKGAMLAYRSVKHITLNTWNGVHMEPSDVVLIPLPLNHSVGMRVLRTALSIGATVVIQNGFTFAKELEINIASFGCTALVSVPASIEVVRRQMGPHFSRVLSKLRYLEFGAGSLSVALKEAISKELPNTLLYNTWGSSETGGAIFLEISKYPEKLGSLGKPMPGITFAVQRDDGSFDSEAHDLETSGRMALKGDMRMVGYFNMPEETAKTVQGGWLVTNDLAYQDSDGFVYMLGRADDIINVGGEKVSPAEIETVASGYPFFRECAVISGDDQLLGQVPVLYYVLNDERMTFKTDDFYKYMESRVEKFKIPQKFVQLDALPRNRMLKLDRKALKAMWKDSADEKHFLGVEFKKFGLDNLEDACKVVRNVFSEGACEALRMGLKYPDQKLLADAGAGEVVYEDGEPVGFHAAFPRWMVNKDKPFVYISGSTIGVLRTAKTPFLAIQILKKTQMEPRAGSLLFIGNTINKNRMNLNKILRSKYKGPHQCAEKRIMVVRPLGLLMYLVRTKVLKRKSIATSYQRDRRDVLSFRKSLGGFEVRSLGAIDTHIFGDFWKAYVLSNKGLAASRTPEELQWMFGDRLGEGNVAVLGLFVGEHMEGYVVVATEDGVLWSVKDLIALGNDLKRIDLLLVGLKCYMKDCTSAVQCQITGYPTPVQPTLARHFPIKRALENNQYFIHFQDTAKNGIGLESLDSLGNWLFGAYEGDSAML